MPLQSPPLLAQEIFKERYCHLWHIPHDVLLTVTKLYQCCNNEAMITFTGFHVKCFNYVLAKFANMFDAFTFVDCKIASLKEAHLGERE